MIMQDMHLHTKYSDGKNTIEEMADAALRCGLQEICFTDHVRQYSDWWPEYFSECQRAAKKYAPVLNIFCGVESKIYDFHGNLDLPEDLDSQLIRVAAIHRLPDGNGGFFHREALKALKGDAVACWFNTLAGLKENPQINRIAHPFSLFPYMDIDTDEGFWERITAIMDNSTYLIEYNLKYDHIIIPQAFWDHFSARTVIGSDSHSVEALERTWQKNCLRSLE